MIEIITKEVKMPPINERRYQRGKCLDPKGWEVVDTETGNVRFKGKYTESCLALHNLNKKHYRNFGEFTYCTK